MITLQTSGSNNDLTFTDGKLSLISGDDQIRQAIRETLHTFFGEWFLDNTIGVPWFQEILVSNPNLDTIQAILINAIISVPGVSSLESFTFGYLPANRGLTVTFQARTTNGQIINSVQSVGV